MKWLPGLRSMSTALATMEFTTALCTSSKITNVFIIPPMMLLLSRCNSHKDIMGIMDQPGIQFESNAYSYSSALHTCANIKPLKQARAHLLVTGLDQNPFLKTKLVSMYALHGNADNARLVFDKTCEQNVFLWNTLIRGYAGDGPCEDALLLYYKMKRQGIQPDKFTFPFVLKACAATAALQVGQEIHDHIVISGFESDVYVGNALIDMYAKCGGLEDARQVFDKMPKRDVVSWNAMLAGYAQSDNAKKTLTLFNLMLLAGVKPDLVSMVTVIPACAHVRALQQGKWIHAYIIRHGFESDLSVGNSLLDMYSKCGSLELACQMFDKMPTRNVVSWNAMIAGYAQNEHVDEALTLFNQMQLEDEKPNPVTLASVVQACAHLGVLQQGEWIHNHIIRSGFESNIFVVNALIDMYAKCGSIEIAHRLFNQIKEKNVVSWSTMIAGYAQNGHANDALTLFNQMQLADTKPNSVTIVSVLSACAHLGALQQGKWIHDYIIRSGFKLDVFMGTALIDMYAKCGRVELARQLFDKMSKRNVVTWSAMIAGYGMHGHGENALQLFRQMRQDVKPNYITFVAVLSACSHAGLVNEGWQYFDCMSQDYGITPKVQHYACMVDLLGRAGLLDEAHDFIKRMPLEPNAGVWGALLGACRIHGDIKLGQRVAECLFELEPSNAGYYVLMANIYAAAGRWDDAAKVRTLMKERGLKKTSGCSFIEVNNGVHTFLVGDRLNPQSENIYATLETLTAQMEEAGYVPNTNFVLHDVEEGVKEDMLFSHSEKLAIVFGLINTSPGTPIQITKNLRVCRDCHIATKFISKIVSREIIVRDANRFHVFKDGSCSCGDYW